MKFHPVYGIHHRIRSAGHGLLVAILLVSLVPLPMLSPPSAGDRSEPLSPAQPAGVQEPAPGSPSIESESQSWIRPVDVEAQPDPLETAEIQAQPSLDSAHVRDVDLGGGLHQAIVSSSPINYLAEDGTWQPIDPRFQAVEAGGFANRANSLQIEAAGRRAILRLRQGQAEVGWAPQALALSDGAGEGTILAALLEADRAGPGVLSADGRTIRYEQSWTLDGLVEEISAGPGQVEQSLILAERPEGAGKFLTLRATLYLPPGGSLYAGGASYTRSFDTAGPVEVRDAQGQAVLSLVPPRAFELADPAVAVDGSYHLAPLGEGAWRVEVRTPWTWWADPARSYPAVLDPTIVTLKAVDMAQVYSDWPKSCPDPVPPQAGEYGGPTVGIGQSPDCGAVRALIRFQDFPALPPGYQVTAARLFVVPIRGYYETWCPGCTPLWSMVEPTLHYVTEDWDPATVNWSNQPGVSAAVYPAGDSYMDAHHPSSSIKHMDTGWDLDPAVVGAWLAGGDNFGLELRAVEEGPCSTNSWGYPSCNFVAIPTENVWEEEDKLDATGNPGYLYFYTDRGGVALVVTYSAPPLADGQPVIHWEDLLLPRQQGEDYRNTDHAYKPPESSGWMAVGVKGLDHFLEGGLPYYHAAGSLSFGYAWLGRGRFYQESSGDPSAPPQLNYFAFRAYNANMDPVAVQPPQDLPANGDLDTYMVEAAQAVDLPGNPTFHPYGPTPAITHTFRMSTTHLFQVFNLNLVDDSKVMVDVRGDGVEARLFRPTAQPYGMMPKEQGLLMDSKNSPYETLGSGDGGTWGLVLSYAGHVSEPDWGSSDPATIEVTVRVRACDLYSTPRPNGCAVVNCPVSSNCHVVGPYRICTDAGFDEIAPNEYASRLKAVNGQLYSTCIGWQGSTGERWVTVDDGPVYFTTASPYALDGNYNTLVSLARFSGENIQEQLFVWKGDFQGYPSAGPDYGNLVPYAAGSVNYPLTLADQAQASAKVSVQLQQLAGEAVLAREVETDPEGNPGATETFSFDLDWWMNAEGYTGHVLLPQAGGVPDHAHAGSLTFLFGGSWEIDLDSAQNRPFGLFTNLRNQGTIVQPTALGGAWREVQALILPYGRGLGAGGGPPYCTGYCLDLRHPADSPSQERRTWKLPDIEITGQAQTLVYNRPGEVNVFSSDHPNAVNDVGVPFSFRTFEGQVQVTRDTCPPGGTGNKVTVIRGYTNIALPGLGSDTDPSQMVSASFTLCQNELHQVEFHFDTAPSSPHPLPPIPVGTTGVFLTHVGGTVTIDPAQDTVAATIHIRYQSGAGGETLQSRMSTVTIDTRGLFDVQTGGTIVGWVNYDGHVWVTWSPILDVGVEVEVTLFDTAAFYVGGHVAAHVWQGQGWQGQYYWLPADSAIHASGSFAAELRINQGFIKIKWAPDLPPWDIKFGITLAFGEFCKNDSCSDYEWGVKAVISEPWTLGFDLGFYIGFESGLDLVLGSDGHVLVDQYGSKRTTGPDVVVADKPYNLHHVTVPDPLADPYTHTLTITQYTGSALVGLGWLNLGRSPELTLLTPGGQEVTPANAASYGISVTEAITGRLYGLRDPLPGEWQAKVSNIQGDENYHLIFFANKKPPQVDLLTPPAGGEPWYNDAGPYALEWAASDVSPDVDMRISLYYSLTGVPVLTPSQQYSGVIVENWPLTSGSYDWDVTYMATGDYHVYARVTNGHNKRYQPRPTITGTNQIPGVVTVQAPGVLHIVDDTPPAASAWTNWIEFDGALKVCWEVSAEHDLAGYLIHYSAPDYIGNYLEHDLRVHATVVYSDTEPRQQCARIGGLPNGDSIPYDVYVYDTSGNVSSPVSELGVPLAGARDQAPAPGTASGTVGPGHAAVISWTEAETPTLVAGYLLYYAADYLPGPGQGDSGATEGPSPIDVGNVLNYTLHGLEPGRLYHFAVQPYDDDGRLGPISLDLPLLLTDNLDDNGDGMPDDWATAYNLVNPYDDPDGDCLTNLFEYLYWEETSRPIHPRQFDSDTDYFSDGEEFHAGSNPVDSLDWPSKQDFQPRMHLDRQELTFHAGTGDAYVPAQYVRIDNYGGGTLTLTASTTTPWLTANLVGNRLQVGIDKTGLTMGYYEGTITIQGEESARSCTQNSPQTVTVELWLYEGLLRQPPMVYLPVVFKNTAP